MNDLNRDKLIMSERDLAATEEEGEVFDIELSKEALVPVPNVKRVNFLQATINALDSDQGFIVKVNLDGEVVVTAKNKKGEKAIAISTEDYLDLSGEENDMDIVPVKGLYDFMPAIKAIFYWAIPKDNEGEDFPTSGNGYEVISISELAKRKNKPDIQENPFKIAFQEQKKSKKKPK